jgi:hypothetical protein
MRRLIGLLKTAHFYRSALGLVSTSFLVLVALPTFLFYLNDLDLSWDGRHWLALFLKSMIVCLPIALSISIAKSLGYSAIYKYLSSSVLVIFLYVLIRTVFFPISFGSLDGAEILDVTFYADISLWVSVFIVVGLFFAVWNFRSIAEDLLLLSSIAIVFLVSYLSISVNDVVQNVAETNSDGAWAYTRFSSTTNVIVFSFDSVQNNTLLEALSDSKELSEQFEGFTNYSNVLSFAPNTILSLTSTLIGRYLETGVNGKDIHTILDQQSESSVMNTLLKRGYDVDGINVPGNQLCTSSSCITHRGVMPESFPTTTELDAYDASILRLIPKSFSWPLVQRLSRIDYFDDSVINQVRSDKDPYARSMKLELFYFRKMYEEAHLVETPVLKFHHYIITHTPLRYSGDCSYDEQAPQNLEFTKSEITCILREFSKMLAKLKDLGVYDKSLIILTSDHGYTKYLASSPSCVFRSIRSSIPVDSDHLNLLTLTT